MKVLTLHPFLMGEHSSNTDWWASSSTLRAHIQRLLHAGPTMYSDQSSVPREAPVNPSRSPSCLGKQILTTVTQTQTTNTNTEEDLEEQGGGVGSSF